MDSETLDGLIYEVLGNQMQPVREEICGEFPSSKELPVYALDGTFGRIWLSIAPPPEFFWLNSQDFAASNLNLSWDEHENGIDKLTFVHERVAYEMWFFQDRCYSKKCDFDVGTIYQTAVDYPIRMNMVVTSLYFVSEKDVARCFGDFPYLLVLRGGRHEFVSRTA